MAAFSAADELSITEGLTSWQVFQCNAENLARIVCSGAWLGEDGPVTARVLKDDLPLDGWQEVGTAAGGAWTAAIESVPAGGPYTIALRIGDVVQAVDHVLAGDLWVLAGQSNMQGVGNMLDVVPPHPQVNMLAMNGAWRQAEEPLHILPESPDIVHARFDTEEARQAAIESSRNAPKGAGLGLAFAVEMVQRTGRPVGLVCTAHGGTSMDQWNPEKRDEGGASLYGSMYAQVQRAGGSVRGMLWYQGESDANPNAADAFRDKFEAFIAAVRSDFNAPELPVYYVQIGRFTHPDPQPAPWNQVQAMQLATEQSVDAVGLAPSVDLELDDLIHIGTAGLKRLGKRLANLAERDLYGAGLLGGPRPMSITREDTPYGKQIRVQFTGVNGRLTALGRPLGFSMSAGADGPLVPFLFKIDLPEDAPDPAVLWVHEVPENAHIWYGRGLDPCANITDEADMAVPVFGPMPLGE